MYELREYRPGRWARVDPETGAVLGLATDGEADGWIRGHLLQAETSPPALETLPLFADLDQGEDLQPEPEPAAVATEEPAEVPGGNGNGRIVFVAWRDRGHQMEPAHLDGRLLVFQNLDQARAAAGSLGVGSPTDKGRLPAIARRWGLGMPNGNGRGERWT